MSEKSETKFISTPRKAELIKLGIGASVFAFSIWAVGTICVVCMDPAAMAAFAQ